MHLINCGVSSMSDSSSDKEENLSEEWTLVDNEESAAIEEYTEASDEDREEGVAPPPPVEEEVEEEEEEVEVTEEEEEEEDALTKGQKVQEIKGDADTESLSSEGSPEEKIRRRRVRKPEATQDEETDLSLASSPSLPEDLPAIRPDPQYVHIPSPELNNRLTIVVVTVVILVCGLGIGHFLGIIDLSEDVEPGWSRRSLWDENLNAAQIMEELQFENEELQERILELQAANTEPIKIKGTEGKEARSLRERINHLISENEDMRLALAKHQFSELPDGDKTEFNKLSQENYHLRTTVLKLTHLVPDNDKLENSLQYLKDQHLDMLRKVGKIRYEQPLPKELSSMVKQLEEMRNVVAQEAKKRHPPSSIANARSYLAFMGQVFSQFTYLHDWDEKSAAEKIDLAKDIFAYWLPKGVKLSAKMQEDITKSRGQFNTLKSSLRKKWKQLKELTNPDTIVNVGQSTVAKMNRVIVNVVNKIKEIGQTTIMSTNKQLEQSIFALFSGLAKLNKQFDETWKSLEIRISMSEKDGGGGDDDEENDDDEEEEEEEDDDDNEAEGDVIDSYIKSSTSDKDDSETTEDKIEVKPTSTNRDNDAKDTDKKATIEVKPPAESKHIAEEIQKQIFDKEIEKIRGKEDKKGTLPKRKIGKDKKVEIKKEEKLKPARTSEKNEKEKLKPARTSEKSEKEVPKVRGREFQEKKSDRFVKEDKKEEKKSLVDKLREKKEEEKLAKEDSKYFKGQYNRYDKVREDDNKDSIPDYTQKYYRRKDEDDDDDDEDDEDEDDNQRATGLKRHWEKPQKKNYFRDNSGPKKQFIRRRGNDQEIPSGGRGLKDKKKEKRGKEWNKKEKSNKDNKVEYKTKNREAKWHNDKSRGNKNKYDQNKYKVGFNFEKGKFNDREKLHHSKNKHQTKQYFRREKYY